MNNSRLRSVTLAAMLGFATACLETSCITARTLGGVVWDNTIFPATNPVTTAKEVAWKLARPFDRKPGPGPETIEEWLTAHAPPPTEGEVKLLFRGEAFFSRLTQEIENAEESVAVQTYLFDNDDVGAEYVKLLRKKARTIPVRVLSDGIGNWYGTTGSADSQDPEYKTEFDDVYKVLGAEGAPNLHSRRTPNLLLGSDHTKIFAVDGKVAFTGGMNIAREYRVDYRDLMIECRGPLVGRVMDEFEGAWHRSRLFGDFRRPVRKKKSVCEDGTHFDGETVPVWVLRTEPFKREILKAQIAACQRARKRIYIENPFLWDREFVKVLCEARSRGVDVRVTIPADSGSVVGNSGTFDMANVMLDAGIRIFIVPGSSHVKAAIYDDWACVGTCNYDRLSFSINLELNFFIRDRPFVEAVKEEVFVEAWAESREMSEPIPLKLLDRVNSIASMFL